MARWTAGMSTHELRSAAARWRAAEVELALLARQVAALDEVPWRSAAAEQFRVRVAERAARLHRLAGACAGVAARLDSVAGRIEGAGP
jgi:hypothetical protein